MENGKEMTEKKQFRNNSRIVRSSFILGLISILSGVIILLLLWSGQPKAIWLGILLYALEIAIGFGGTIVSGIALREGKNVYSILGMIFSVIVMLYYTYMIISLKLMGLI